MQFAVAMKKLYHDMLVPMCIVPRGDDDGSNEDGTWWDGTAKKYQCMCLPEYSLEVYHT